MKVLILLLLALTAANAKTLSYQLKGRSLQDAGSEVEIKPDSEDPSANAAAGPPADNSNNPTNGAPP